MSSTAATRPGLADRFLTGVERVGNKLPDPFMLFLILFGITAVVTTGMALADVTVQVPGAEESTVIKGLFTGEGLTWLTENLGANYLGFPPLATVLPILLAVGVAEKSGLLGALIRRVFGSAPRWALPYAVGFVGVVGSVMSDSAFVIIPPLAALVFKAAGRHPVAGLLGGFAAAGAGYSTNLLVTSLDALFAGITTAVTENLPNPGSPVTPLSNYYFNIASSVVLILIAGFIIDKVLEPRLSRQNVPVDELAEDGEHASAPVVLKAELEPQEARALRWSMIVGAAVALAVLVAVIIPDSPWRNEAGGFLPRSPLLSSIVFIVFLLFTIPGLVYGRIVGTITTGRDVPRVMGEAIRDMAGFLVLAFILGQFIALFNWSGIGSWIAVAGASGLEAIGLTGYPAVIAFILLASVLNLFIISGSSMWTLMASVFVPLFALLGYEPAFIQGAFRVGDSATQVITPLNPYMIVLLTMLRKYEPEAGLGTLMARMLPFVVPFWLAWVAILTVFFYLDLPLGPGNGIFIQQ
ncbi:MAG: P-aminobenzoyl-glutamate transporter [Micrococcaceae bacterium]|jgi:aminobenzoyl-glutamate transport protein|uniref:AbgT family transporter n=1 Tax=Arthrobacter sp. PL16 TaxID=3071720 RepID=UPI002E0BD3BF|nr:P-aminobenzoyl-glutamate transporter [Micrococcaceae bacterium]MEC5198656.1 aminobenzoyl-glutamate transport protein [Arthrobacter sp. PL16]